jgi:hypothetical protein
MTLIIYKKKKILTFLFKKNFMKKNQHYNLEISTFKSLIARLLFVQSDVFCALCICRGVAKDNKCEDQALEMNRKVLGEGVIRS